MGEVTCSQPQRTSLSGYNHGCRCARCAGAKRASRKGEYPARKVGTLAERLLSRLEFKANGCVEWTGSLTTGYGKIGMGSTRTVLVHRLIYDLQNGPIPSGMMIDHRCRNRACCNPSHLQVVNNSLNLQNRSGASIRSATGIRGVCRQGKKWMAYANLDGRRYSGGYYEDIEDAAIAVIALRNRIMTNNLADRQ